MQKKDEAYNDWKNGLKYKEIAQKYGVTLSAVKSWATRDWKKKEAFLADKSVAQDKLQPKLQPKPRGAPKGNKNALGHKGGPPKGNKNNYKHGLYERVYWDTLEADEVSLIFNMNFEEEQSLIDQLRLLTVRERRLMKQISYKNNEDIAKAYDNVVSRNLQITGNLINDAQQQQQEMTVKTPSVFEIILKLEAELTRVQSKKTRCIEALNKIRIDRKRFNSDAEYSAQNDGFIEAMTNQTSNIWDDDKEGVGDEPS